MFLKIFNMTIDPIYDKDSICIIGAILTVLLILRLFRMRINILQRIFGIVFAVMIAASLTIMCLRPMEKAKDSKVNRPAVNVLYVLDNSISMWADDGYNNKKRILSAAQICQESLEELSGGNFALIVFNDESHIKLPLTQDAESLKDAFMTVAEPSYFYAQGSNLNLPMEDISKVNSHMREKEDYLNILVYLSDGEITDDSKLKSYEEFKECFDDGIVIGFGTKEGSKMFDCNGYEIKTPISYETAYTHMDDTTLKQIASDMEMNYYHESDRDAIKAKFKQIYKEAHSIEDKSTEKLYDDIWFEYLPLFIGGIILYSLCGMRIKAPIEALKI